MRHFIIVVDNMTKRRTMPGFMIKQKIACLEIREESVVCVCVYMCVCVVVVGWVYVCIFKEISIVLHQN